MSSEIAFFRTLDNLEITEEEVVGLVTSQFSSAIGGLVLVGVMSMMVKEFYDMLAAKDKEQEEEVLNMVKDIW